MKDRLSAAAFKCRGLFWTVLALLLLIFAKDFDAGRYVSGLFFVIMGQALRFWAAGYIPKYRTEVITAPELVTAGPYSYIRNPLYAGNFIMGLGWALMAGYAWVLFFCAAFLLLYCLIIIPAEEKFLEEKFGDAYLEYKKYTNALLPNLLKPRKEAGKAFDLKESFSKEKYSLRMHLIVTLLLTGRLILGGRL